MNIGSRPEASKIFWLSLPYKRYCINIAEKLGLRILTINLAINR